MFDALDHPDMTEIGIRLQRRLDRILECEQDAADVLTRRRATIRDRLVDIEDQEGFVTVTTISGQVISGSVATVAVDHVELDGGTMSTMVALDQICTVSVA